MKSLIDRHRYLEPADSPSKNPKKFTENAIEFIKKAAKAKPYTSATIEFE